MVLEESAVEHTNYDYYDSDPFLDPLEACGLGLDQVQSSCVRNFEFNADSPRPCDDRDVTVTAWTWVLALEAVAEAAAAASSTGSTHCDVDDPLDAISESAPLKATVEVLKVLVLVLLLKFTSIQLVEEVRS